MAPAAQSGFRYGMWRIYDFELRHTVHPETLQRGVFRNNKRGVFTSFSQPTLVPIMATMSYVHEIQTVFDEVQNP